MAHELEIVNGQAQMAYVGDLPWHGIGTKVEADLTPDQFQKVAGLDWEVEKQPLMTPNGVKVPNKEALVRTSDNSILDVVGTGWNPVQNSEAFEFFHEYVMAGDMEMHTAGSLKDGNMVWGLAKVKDTFDILGGDQVDSYLLFSNPHQYGKSIDIRFTPIRVVCNNTLSLSLGQKVANSVSLNHRTTFNPDSVKETLGIASEKFAQYKETAEFLSSKRFGISELIQYYNEVFPRTYQGKKEVNVKTVGDLTTNAQKAYEVLETQPGAEFGEGTWWQALNSVTYLTDHQMGREADTRLTSAWFGSNQTRKVRAVEKAVEYALAA